MTEALEGELVPFHDDEILSIWVDGQPEVVVVPTLDLIGIASQPQLRKLQDRSWGSYTQRVVQVGGQRRQVITCTNRSFRMLLANVNENSVKDPFVRDKLIRYQSEMADVIDAYWARGAAFNPRVPQTAAQMFALVAQQFLEQDQRLTQAEIGTRENRTQITEVRTDLDGFRTEVTANVSVVSGRMDGADAKIQHLEEVTVPRAENWDQVSSNGAWIHATALVKELKLPGIGTAAALNRRLDKVFIFQQVCDDPKCNCGKQHWLPYADCAALGLRLEPDLSPYKGKARRAGYRFPTVHYSPETWSVVSRFLVDGVPPTREAAARIRKYNIQSNAA